MRRNLIKAIPYLVAILVGLVIFFMALDMTNMDVRGLFINIAASLIAIPFILIGYDLAQAITQKHLNETLFEYAKMKSEKELMTIISQVMKIVYSYDEYELSLTSIQKFLSLNKDDLQTQLSTQQYLGFQILKQWDASEKYFEDILQNSLILKIFENKQIITLVEIVKSIGTIDYVFHNTNIFEETGETLQQYKVVAGFEISIHNAAFPDRYLLLKHLESEKHQVVDFGDFGIADKEKLLNLFKLDRNLVNPLADDIFKFIQTINKWFALTGKEMIFDPRHLRIRERSYVTT